jgi:hypothetical protein
MGTHTYVALEVGDDTYKEIKYKLEQAGYHHAFMDDGAIDMHGIGLIIEQPRTTLDLTQKLNEQVKLIAEQYGTTSEEVLENAQKLLLNSHKAREAARIKAHGLPKGDEGDYG